MATKMFATLGYHPHRDHIYDESESVGAGTSSTRKSDFTPSSSVSGSQSKRSHEEAFLDSSTERSFARIKKNLNPSQKKRLEALNDRIKAILIDLPGTGKKYRYSFILLFQTVWLNFFDINRLSRPSNEKTLSPESELLYTCARDLMPYALTRLGIVEEKRYMSEMEHVLVPTKQIGSESIEQNQFDKFSLECLVSVKRNWNSFTKEVLMSLYTAYVTSGNQFTGGVLKNFYLTFQRPPCIGPSIVGGVHCSSFQGVFGMRNL